MYIHGEFVNQKSETIGVYIVTNGDRTKEVIIGDDDDSDMYFPADDPVSTTSEVNDTFDHLLCSSATITLYTRSYISDFFCASARNAIVNIYKAGKCVFAGFIEPQAYSQDYNELYDELSLSCIDVLSALQYSKYRNIGSSGVSYSSVKSGAVDRTFYDIMTDILNAATSGIDILNGSTAVYNYDGSKSVSSGTAYQYTIFSNLSISELMFLGDEEDDVWQQDAIIEEIMRYLNLHVIQDGFTFYIFSWESVKSADTITWHDIVNGTASTTTKTTKNITVDIVDGTDAKISVGEIFNQLLLTCDVQSVESIIESPLESDSLVSSFSNKQKYMVEYSSEGNGTTARKCLQAMILGNSSDYDGGVITTWYMQTKKNTDWLFGAKNGDFADSCETKTNQQLLPNKLRSGMGAAIISFGSVEIKVNKEDNSPTSKVDMSDYLVISVNGNGDDGETTSYPQPSDIENVIPVAVYNGNKSGGTYSPSDADTVNYIVISGSLILNPVMAVTGTYKYLKDNSGEITNGMNILGLKTVPSRNNTDGRYLCLQWWKAAKPNDTATYDESEQAGLVPYTSTGPEKYEFKYSAIGESSDTVSKVAVLACMLIIGDKCVVETGASGKISDFTWHTYKTLAECADEDEYYQQSFTVGFDPKIGDKLIGTEFNMQNNIDYTLGIDAEGIAIPVTKGDELSGAVKFMILGPVNTVWDEVTRRHPTFFRHTKWETNSVPLLAHVSSIFVKDFKVEIYSDNGLVNNSSDKDIVYLSNTDETYVNKKDDLEFKFNSSLTSTERQQLGVTDTVKMSTPYNLVADEGLLTIYDKNKAEQVKAEQDYVDSYYTEYSTPHLLLTQTFQDTGSIVGMFDHYIHPALGKEFFVQGINRNLIEGSAEVTLKETDK